MEVSQLNYKNRLQESSIKFGTLTTTEVEIPLQISPELPETSSKTGHLPPVVWVNIPVTYLL